MTLGRRFLPIVYVSTPDFKDAFQDGWEKRSRKSWRCWSTRRKTRRVAQIQSRINVLPGCHLTPGDMMNCARLSKTLGSSPSFLPDLGGSLDGHIPDEFMATTIGEIGVEDVAAMGCASWTIAVGAQMRPAAETMERKTGTPFRLFERLCGLSPNDELIAFLEQMRDVRASEISSSAGPACDAMLDGHFHIGGRGSRSARSRTSFRREQPAA